mgnify:CR=1 FL=1
MIVTELQSLFSQYALYAWLLLLTLVLLALFWLQSLRRRLAQLSQRYASLTKGVDGISMVDALGRHVSDLESLSKRVDEVAGHCRELDEKIRIGLRRVGIVRFNPFEDTGGDQSFALAVLDERGDGFVVSSLFSRTGSRLYAKPVKGGRSKYTLSDEEEQAIIQASLMP